MHTGTTHYHDGCGLGSRCRTTIYTPLHAGERWQVVCTCGQVITFTADDYEAAGMTGGSTLCK